MSRVHAQKASSPGLEASRHTQALAHQVLNQRRCIGTSSIGTSSVFETMHWHTKHCIRDDAHSQAEGTAANLSRRDSLCSGDFTGGGCLQDAVLVCLHHVDYGQVAWQVWQRATCAVTVQLCKVQARRHAARSDCFCVLVNKHANCARAVTMRSCRSTTTPSNACRTGLGLIRG